MEAAREWNLKWLPGKGDKPKHWYRTQQFAWHVFNEFNNTFNTALEIGNVDESYDFNPLTEIHKIKPYYAAANSAKCCMNNKSRSQADSILFKNCMEYILGELAILNPDILVTQGRYARMVAEKMKINKILHTENISGASRKEDDFHVYQMNSGKTIVCITHDINLAGQYSDEVLLLGGGSRYIVGCTGEVFSAERIAEIFGVKSFVGNVGTEKFFLPLGKFARDIDVIED